MGYSLVRMASIDAGAEAQDAERRYTAAVRSGLAPSAAVERLRRELRVAL